MDLLTIIIVLLILQLEGSISFLQNDRWFFCWMHAAGKFALPSVLNLILVIGLPCFCVLFLLLIVHNWFWGALSLLINVCVLGFSLGRGEYSRYIHEYIEAWNLKDFARIPGILNNLDKDYPLTSDPDPVTFRDDARRAFILSAFKRWFVVLFWYLLFGPVVALLYRLISLSLDYYLKPDHEDEILVPLLQNALFVMEWPMSRLLALCFVVSGKIGQVFAHWCQSVLNVSTDNDAFILASADVALATDATSTDTMSPDRVQTLDVLQDDAISEARAIKQLLNRCLILIIVFAFIIAIT